VPLDSERSAAIREILSRQRCPWPAVRTRGGDSGPKRKVFAIAETAFAIIPEPCSESTRNRVRLHPGIAFGIAWIPHPGYNSRA
jgi:hypothetical protein